MRFSIWWKSWLKALSRVLSATSEKRRRNESERRKRKSLSLKGHAFLKSEAPRPKRSRSGNARTVDALVEFGIVTLGLILLPIGLFDWARKSAAAKRRSAPRCRVDEREHRTSVGRSSVPKFDTEPHCHRSLTEKDIFGECASQKTKKVSDDAPDVSTPTVNGKVSATVTDGNVPKTSPRNEKDRYVKKRMIIADSPYRDENAFDKLFIGAYLELDHESEEAVRSGAILLLHSGSVVGCVAESDRLALLTNLKLGRRIYAIISDIYRGGGKNEYEYEAWFDTSKSA